MIEIVIDLMNNKFQANINGTHICYAIRLGRNDSRSTNGEEMNGPVCVAFETQKVREKIIRSRGKLKDTNIWIGEDLTPKRSELAFKARRAVKQKLIEQTWTVGGHIFIKIASNGRPRKI